MSGTLFVVLLVVVLGAIGFLALQGRAAAAGSSQDLSETAVESAGNALYQEAMALAGQDTAMPVQIFELAGRINNQEDSQAALELAERIYQADQGRWGFGRRVAITTLRFKGAESFGPDLRDRIDRLVLAALNDSAVWVRYDAAWVAGRFALNTPAIRDRITAIKQDLGKPGAATGNADESLLKRVDEYLEKVK